MSGKPNDIQQWAWEEAAKIKVLPEVKFSHWEKILQADIARAVSKARSEAFGEAIEVAASFILYQITTSGTASNPYVSASDIVRALREKSRAERNDE